MSVKDDIRNPTFQREKLRCGFPFSGTDGQVMSDGRLLDIVDDAWRADVLPKDDIIVPIAELPDPEADNGDSHMTLKEQEQKWTDLSLGTLSKQHQSLPN